MGELLLANEIGHARPRTAPLRSDDSRRFESDADDRAFAHRKRHGYSAQLFAEMMRQLKQA